MAILGIFAVFFDERERRGAGVVKAGFDRENRNWRRLVPGNA
jgi:hypothetical protein